MSSSEHDPATLEAIDTVDVVALDASAKVGGVTEFIRIEGAQEVRLTGLEAQRIADLWRRLAPAEPARCHIPPYGLRLWHGGQKVVEASLCWQCNNAYGYAGDQPIWFTFDAGAPVAVSLLMQLRHVLPGPS